MNTFKYYKRGMGELDTSNFPELSTANYIEVPTLNEKTFMSLLALSMYMGLRKHKLLVYIDGYVAHMRGDKDMYPVSQLYQLLTNRNMKLICEKVQHESANGIQSNTIEKIEIALDLHLEKMEGLVFVGADASVIKFMPDVDVSANKIREAGKVLSVHLDMSDVDTKSNTFIIVDDILGGGATISMVKDEILKTCPDAEIYIWVEYNEGIHEHIFVEEYSGAYIGDLV